MSTRPPTVRAFEQAFADYQQAVAARAFWQGRAGLYAVLRCLGIRTGETVGIGAYTCASVVEAIVQAGGRPQFLDVDADMNIDAAGLQRLTRTPRVLLLQHTFGVPCDLQLCLDWARARSIPIVEDCCHALGARYIGRPVGSFGCAAVFSFQWGKPFSTGEGGMITFNDAYLADEVDRLVTAEGRLPSRGAAAMLAVKRFLHRRSTPALRRQLKRLRRTPHRAAPAAGDDAAGLHLLEPIRGYCRAMSVSQARAGREQLRAWPRNLVRRADNARQVRALLRKAGAQLHEPDARKTPMYLRVPVRVPDKRRVLTEAANRNLDVAGWYETPVHPYRGAVLPAVGYIAADCPQAERAFAEVVTLPTQYALRGAALDETIRIVTMHDPFVPDNPVQPLRS